MLKTINIKNIILISVFAVIGLASVLALTTGNAEAVAGINCSGSGASLQYGGDGADECTASEHAQLIVSPILTEISKLLPFAIVVILPLTVGMVLLRYVFRRTRSKKIGL